MGIGYILPSIHKSAGWQGQYFRMIRWFEKFKKTDPGNFENPNIDEEHDILFACFQNIFFHSHTIHKFCEYGYIFSRRIAMRSIIFAGILGK